MVSAYDEVELLDATDFLDAVSGTQGVAGAADTVLVLSRNREETNAILRVTSRDAREGSYALEIDESGRWNLSGTTLEEAAEAARTEATTAGLGTRMAELVAYVNEHPEGVRASEVAAALHMSGDDAGKYLRRAFDSERITKATRGLYVPAREALINGRARRGVLWRGVPCGIDWLWLWLGKMLS